MKFNRWNHFLNSRTLIRLVIGLPVGVFISEVIAMTIVYFIEGSYWFIIIVDAVITTSIMIPIIYFFSFRPLLINIAKRDRTERIMKFRLRLIEYAETHVLDELLRTILDEIEAFTECTIGFFHFLEPDQETLWLQAWSTNTIQNMCNAEGENLHYGLEQAGIWADCVRLRQPVVHNDYPQEKKRKGLPEGHAPIIRELTVPILRNDNVVAILGVGNKPTKFTADDLDLVSTLADFAWDVVQRKRTEETLQKSEEKFRTVVDWTYDWEQWVTPENNIEYISPSCKRISGYSPEEFISDPSLSSRIIHPDDRELYEDHMELIHNELQETSNVEYRIVARDGSEHWIDHICRPLFNRDQQYLGRRVSNRDITRRKQAEEEISERINRETILTQTIHTMQLDIARDLHDTIGQNISYLRMRLDHFREKNENSQTGFLEEIKPLNQVANETYDLIRGTMDFLQLGSLENLTKLFSQYASQIAERSPININVTSHGQPRNLTQFQTRQVFFIFREALSNIEKYANASKVFVELDWAKDAFELLIEDNGCGFNLEDVSIGTHYGIKFMKERIESIDGLFSIQSIDGKGTAIKITFPYEQLDFI